MTPHQPSLKPPAAIARSLIVIPIGKASLEEMGMCHQVSACFWWTLDECILCGLGRWGLAGGCQVPGEEILDLPDGMIGDSAEHSAEIEFRIDPVELGRSDEGIDGSGTLTAAIGAHE